MDVLPVPLGARTVSKLWQLAVRKEVETSSRQPTPQPRPQPAACRARARIGSSSVLRSATGGASEAGVGKPARGPSWTSIMALPPPSALAPPSPTAVRVTRPRSVTLSGSLARARAAAAASGGHRAAWGDLGSPHAAALLSPDAYADGGCEDEEEEALIDACNLFPQQAEGHAELPPPLHLPHRPRVGMRAPSH